MMITICVVVVLAVLAIFIVIDLLENPRRSFVEK
jgi:hypothetical protein